MHRYFTGGGLAVALIGTATIATGGGLEETVVEPIVVEQPTQAPAFTPASAFAGGYVGGQLGYGSVDVGPTIEGDGLIYGLHAGYNFPVGGNFLVGAEVDYDFSDIELSDGAGDLDSVLRLKLRGGTDLGGIFVYGSAGWAEAETSDLGSDDGIFYGLGAAYALSDQITVGGEYLYHDFEDFNGSGLDVEAGTFTARVSYNF